MPYGRRDRVAVHGGQGQFQAHGREHRIGLHTGADDHRVEGLLPAAGPIHLGPLARAHGQHRGVELEPRAQLLRLGLEQLRELPAIADAVLRQMHGGVQRHGQVQCRLQPTGAAGVDQLMVHAQ
jgi:hypothetical protein